MKKFFAIVMLALLLFNFGGYTLLFQYLIYESDSSIMQDINNNNYRATDLVEVKLPVDMHIQDWDDYAVISGQVQFEGKSYNYAEIKMTRDTIYMLCIPNNDKPHLVNARTVYAKQVNDMPVSKKAHSPLLKKSHSDYNRNYFTTGNNKQIAVNNAKAKPGYSFVATVNKSIQIPGQPPDAVLILV